MLDALKVKLAINVNFPSPPAIAQQIIALAGEPDIDLTRVAAAVSKDPGLTAKLLRVANSPLYSKRRKSENLRQALVVLGLNAATTLALSFSLLGTYNIAKGCGIDYARYCRRAILGALAARAFGVLKSAGAVDDIFLAALLQDIGDPEFAFRFDRLGVKIASSPNWMRVGLTPPSYFGVGTVPELIILTELERHSYTRTSVV